MNMKIKMNINRRLQTLQRSIQQTSHDILSLTKHIIQHRPMSRIDFRQMLLQVQQQQQQQQHNLGSVSGSNTNRVVLNLLKMDKEVNLIQYHGLQTYIYNQFSSSSLSSSLSSPLSFFTDKWKRVSSGSDNGNGNNNGSTTTTTTTTAGTNTNTSSNSNSPRKTTAKVAFMITSQQRHTLMTELKYTPKQIKSMKPNEAQLILEHSLYNNDTTCTTETTDTTNNTDDNNNSDNNDNSGGGDSLSDGNSNGNNNNNNNSNGDLHWKDAVKKLVLEQQKILEQEEKEEDERIQKMRQDEMDMDMEMEKRNERKSTTSSSSSTSSSTIGNNNTTLSIGFEEEETTAIQDKYQYHDQHNTECGNNNNALLLSQGNGNRNGNQPLDIYASTNTSPITNTSIPTTEAATSNNEHNETLKSGQEQEYEQEHNNENAEKRNIWFEVIESSSGEAVALYKTREEAEECLTIKEDLHKKQMLQQVQEEEQNEHSNINPLSSTSTSTATSTTLFLVRERTI